MLLLVAGVAATLLIAVSFSTRDRNKVSRLWLWGGLLAPMSVGLNQTATAVEGQPTADTSADLLRLGLPVAALAIGVILSPPIRRGHSGAVAFLGLFVVWSMVSALWSVEPFATFVKASALAAMYALGLALARRYVDGPQMLQAIVGVAHLLLISAAIGAVVAPGIAFARISDGSTRLVGIWPAIHPNVMGLISIVAVIGIATRVGPRWALKGGAPLMLGIVAIADLLLARTRLALILCSALLLVSLLRSVRQRPAIAAVIPIGIVAAVLGVLSSWGHIQQFLLRGQTQQQVSSLTGRIPLWENGLRVWDERPWTGFGYYSGHRYAVPPVPGSGTSSNLDNMWVELLVDVGLVGAALMLGAVALGVTRLVRAQNTPNYRTFALATAVAFTAATTFNPSLQLVAFIGTFFVLLVLAEQPTQRLSSVSDDEPWSTGAMSRP